MNLLGSDVLIVMMLLGAAAVLAAPGLLAYRRALKEDESVVLKVQVEKMADEIMRLQVLVDDQARKLSEMDLKMQAMERTHQMELVNAQGLIGMLFGALKRTVTQLVQAGIEPGVDLDAMGKLLP